MIKIENNNGGGNKRKAYMNPTSSLAPRPSRGKDDKVAHLPRLAAHTQKTPLHLTDAPDG